MSMRIGIDATGVWGLQTGTPSGIINYALEIIAGLLRVAPQHNFHIYFRNGILPEHEHLSALSEVHIIKSGNRKFLQQARLPFAARANLIDVMFFPFNSASLAFPCPTVTTIHDLHPFVVPTRFDIVHGAGTHGQLKSMLNKTYWRQMLRLACKRSTRIIAPSQATASDINDIFGVSREKIDVIFEGVNLDVFNSDNDGFDLVEFRSRHNLPDRYILCMGTHGYKNLEGAIKAFELLKKPQSEAFRTKLVIAGNPVVISSDVHKLIETLKLAEDVMIVGFFPQEEIKYLYQCAELLLFPSFYEGFGLPVVEAFACGTPVVASNRGALPEVGGDVALYVEPDDYQSMADLVAGLLQDRDFQIKKSRESLDRAKFFSWDRAALSTVKSFEHAIQDR